VKSDLAPATKGHKKFRKAAETSPVEKAKASHSSAGKSVPSSVEKGAPPLVTKASSVLAKGAAAKKDHDPVAKSTPTAKSPPQKIYSPPTETKTVPNASIPPEIPSTGLPSKSPTNIFEAIEKVEKDATGIQPPPAPVVGVWLLISSVLVLVVVVVGGITRLTESGLSITEWRPITGIMPPLSPEAWEEEFFKYKATPEFKM
jgi:cytochrome c oxidase assembly protein subunit 15